MMHARIRNQARACPLPPRLILALSDTCASAGCEEGRRRSASGRLRLGASPAVLLGQGHKPRVHRPLRLALGCGEGPRGGCPLAAVRGDRPGHPQPRGGPRAPRRRRQRTGARPASFQRAHPAARQPRSLTFGMGRMPACGACRCRSRVWSREPRVVLRRRKWRGASCSRAARRRGCRTASGKPPGIWLCRRGFRHAARCRLGPCRAMRCDAGRGYSSGALVGCSLSLLLWFRQARHDAVIATIDFCSRAATLRATPPDQRSLKCERNSVPVACASFLEHQLTRSAMCARIRRLVQTVLSLGGVDIRGMSEKREFMLAADALLASLPPLACTPQVRAPLPHFVDGDTSPALSHATWLRA